MLAPGTAPPGAVGDPTTQHRVLSGVLQPGDKPPARALAQITLGKAGYHPGLVTLCLTHWIQRRWPPRGTVPWTTKTNRPAKANPAGTKRVGRQGRPAQRDRGTRRGRRGERNQTPPPQRTHTPLPRTRPQPGANKARHGAKRARQREGVSPRLRNSTPGQGAGATRGPSRAHAQRTHAPRHKTRHHHGKHPRPTTNEPPRTSPSPAVPTAQQPLSGWTCVRPAGYPTPAGYETAAVRTDVCAPGSERSPCRLRTSRRPDGRVCAQK